MAGITALTEKPAIPIIECCHRKYATWHQRTLEPMSLYSVHGYRKANRGHSLKTISVATAILSTFLSPTHLLAQPPIPFLPHPALNPTSNIAD